MGAAIVGVIDVVVLVFGHGLEGLSAYLFKGRIAPKNLEKVMMLRSL